MKTPRSLIWLILMALVSSLSLFFWTGCSLKAKDQRSKIYIDLSEIVEEARQETPHMTERLGADGDVGSFTTPASAPTSVSDFNCIGINVVGPGIAPVNANALELQKAPTYAQALLNPDSASCSYPGATAGPILKMGGSFTASELAVSVPAGANRVIQVLGVVDPTGVVCQPGGFPDGPNGQHEGATYYEISRVVIPNLFSSQSITLQSTWPTGGNPEDDGARAKRLVNCGSGGNSLAIVDAQFNAGYVDQGTPQIRYSRLVTNTVTFSINGPATHWCMKEGDLPQSDSSTCTVGDWVPLTGGSSYSASIDFINDGPHSVTIWAKDAAGYVSQKALATVSVDMTPPVATGFLNAEGVQANPLQSSGSATIQLVPFPVDGSGLPTISKFSYSTDDGSNWIQIGSCQNVGTNLCTWDYSSVPLDNSTCPTGTPVCKVAVQIFDQVGNYTSRMSGSAFGISQ